MRIHRISGRGVGAATVLLVTAGLFVSPAISASASADSIEVLSSYSASMVTGLSTVMSGTPMGAAYDSANNTVYVTGWDAANGSEIVPVNTSTDAVGTPILLGSADGNGNPQGPIAIDAAGGRAFVPMTDGVLVVVTLGTTSTATAVPLTYQSTQINPQSLAWDATNSTLYLSDTDYPQVNSHAVVFALTLPPSGPSLTPVPLATAEFSAPFGLSVDPTTNKVYGAGNSGLDVIDGATNTATIITSTSGGGLGDLGLQADPTSGRVYYGAGQPDSTERLAYYAGTSSTVTPAQIEPSNANGTIDGGSALDPGYAYFSFYNPDNGQGQPAGSSLVPVDLTRDLALPAINIGTNLAYGGTVDTQNHVAYVAADDGVHVLTPQYQDLTATTTTLSASPSGTVAPGASITYTATVSPAPTSGTVSFGPTGGGTPISGCDAVSVNASTGVATCTTSYGPGTVSVTAAYTGDSSEAASTSNDVSIVVQSNPTITHLTATRFASGATTTTVHPGDTVVFSAQVTGATLNSDPGLVDFWDLKTLTALPGCQGRHLNASAIATCTMHWSRVGTYTVFAGYRDDWGPDARSTSRQLTVKVVPFTTTVSLNPSAWSPRRGALVTFSGRIGPARRATATLQLLVGRTWHRVASTTVAATGRYAMRARVRTTSSWRVIVTGDATHRAGTSRSIRLRVR